MLVRKRLSEDGLIIIVLTISKTKRELISGPDIISRGFVYVRESGDLMDDVKDIVGKTIENCSKESILDWSLLKNNIKDDLKGFLFQQTKRNPMILPIIMEI